jgi:hypothetical protein
MRRAGLDGRARRGRPGVASARAQHGAERVRRQTRARAVEHALVAVSTCAPRWMRASRAAWMNARPSRAQAGRVCQGRCGGRVRRGGPSVAGARALHGRARVRTEEEGAGHTRELSGRNGVRRVADDEAVVRARASRSRGCQRGSSARARRCRRARVQRSLSARARRSSGAGTALVGRGHDARRARARLSSGADARRARPSDLCGVRGRVRYNRSRGRGARRVQSGTDTSQPGVEKRTQDKKGERGEKETEEERENGIRWNDYEPVVPAPSIFSPMLPLELAGYARTRSQRRSSGAGAGCTACAAPGRVLAMRPRRERVGQALRPSWSMLTRGTRVVLVPCDPRRQRTRGGRAYIRSPRGCRRPRAPSRRGNGRLMPARRAERRTAGQE